MSRHKESDNCAVGDETKGKHYSLATVRNKILDSEEVTGII